MMADAKAAQSAVYQALQTHAKRPCFLRLCDSPNALWVTDFPRGNADTALARAALDALDCLCTESRGLWYIDWKMERWRQEMEQLPDTLPPFPAEEALHPAYALCRLWLAHPSEWEDQPMELIRRTWQLAQRPRSLLLKAVPALLGESALRLRTHQPLPSYGASLLAQWLMEQEEKP